MWSASICGRSGGQGLKAELMQFGRSVRKGPAAAVARRLHIALAHPGRPLIWQQGSLTRVEKTLPSSPPADFFGDRFFLPGKQEGRKEVFFLLHCCQVRAMHPGPPVSSSLFPHQKATPSFPHRHFPCCSSSS